MVLGEYLGDPNPTGAMTDALKNGMAHYRRLLAEAGLAPLAIITCDHLVQNYPDFMGDDRKAFCADLVVKVTEMVEQVLEEQGVQCRAPLAYE